MLHDESFGAIALKKSHSEWVVFLLEHANGGHWGFPKGHKESNESPLESAKRELFEETNLRMKQLLIDEPFLESYTFQSNQGAVSKKVWYFLMEVEGDIKLDQSEVTDGGFFPFDKAMQKLTFNEGRSLLSEVIKRLEK